MSIATAVTAGRPIGDPSFGPSAYPQSLPTIASNGNGFLAMWRTDTFGGGVHIDGVMLDCEGRRVSPAAFRVRSFANPAFLQLLPFDDHYAMVWLDEKSVQHVDEVSAAGILIRNMFSRTVLYQNARLFWNGEHFLQVEQTSLAPNPGNRITVTSLDREGTVICSEIAVDKL